MIKTMYLSCFRSAQSWFFVVKLECNTKLFKKLIQYISIDRSLGSINRKSHLTFFLISFSNSALKCFNWFRFLIYPRYIRETLTTFLDCSYYGLCESLVRSLRRFPSHKLRVFKEKIFSSPWWSFQLLPLKLKENTSGCACIWWRIEERRSPWIRNLHVVLSVSSTGG